MKTFSFFKRACLLCIPLFILSCIKNTKEQPVGCEPAPYLVLPFSVLDAGTGQDLFFSATPRYQSNNIYFFKKKDLARKDTIRPVIAGTGTNRVFTVPITNAVITDTLLMKIAANPDDVIIYSIKNGTGECPYLAFDKVSFNGTIVRINQGFIFTK